MSDADDDRSSGGLSRRRLLRNGARGAVAAGLLGSAGYAALDRSEDATSVRLDPEKSEQLVWQIDPDKCVWCGKCATECVVTPSASKCMRDQPYCGYCEVCTGYQAEETIEDREQAENQICPTHAITRVLPDGEYPYYEYLVEVEKCIGCAKCAEGCERYGNGSMYMQVDHDYCVNCAECAIALACPGDAFVRKPLDQAYYFRHRTLFKGLSPWKDNSTKAGAKAEAEAIAAQAEGRKQS